VKKVAIIAFLVMLLSSAYGERIRDCHDGDTCNLDQPHTECLIKGKKPRKYQAIRFWGIDAPELDQEYGKEARDFLELLVYGRDIQLDCSGCDRERKVCKVQAQWQPHEHSWIHVNRAMVQRGWAWDAPDYSKGEFADVQVEAKSSKSGLWQIPNPVDPYEWRKLKRFRTTSNIWVRVPMTRYEVRVNERGEYEARRVK
jgi:micrococcal nuclease